MKHKITFKKRLEVDKRNTTVKFVDTGNELTIFVRTNRGYSELEENALGFYKLMLEYIDRADELKNAALKGRTKYEGWVIEK